MLVPIGLSVTFAVGLGVLLWLYSTLFGGDAINYGTSESTVARLVARASIVAMLACLFGSLFWLICSTC